MTERPRAVRGCRLTGAMVTGLGVVGLVFLPAAVAGEVPPTQPPPAFGNDLILLTRFEPWMIMVMVLSVLAALMGSLWMIYLYIARVRTTEIHRQLLLEAVTEFQYLKLRGNRGPIITGTGSSVITGETPEQRIEREKRIREENERRQ
jgi:hypothetical protein